MDKETAEAIVKGWAVPVHSHGHVNERPFVNRCGGPAICAECAREVCEICGRVGLDAVEFHNQRHQG